MIASALRKVKAPDEFISLVGEVGVEGHEVQPIFDAWEQFTYEWDEIERRKVRGKDRPVFGWPTKTDVWQDIGPGAVQDAVIETFCEWLDPWNHAPGMAPRFDRSLGKELADGVCKELFGFS